MKKYEDLTEAEKLACLSLYPEEAKQDEDWFIRREAYRALGYTDEAKKDKNWFIRREAYRALGYTEDDKKDADSDIRREAKLYLQIIK